MFSVAGVTSSLTPEIDVSGAEAARLMALFRLAGAMTMPLDGSVPRLPLIGLVVRHRKCVFGIRRQFCVVLAARIALGDGAAGVMRPVAGARAAVGTVLGAPLADVIAGVRSPW